MKTKTYKVKAQRSFTDNTILIYSKCGTIPPTVLPNDGAFNIAIGDRYKAYFECRLEGKTLVLMRELRRQTW